MIEIIQTAMILLQLIAIALLVGYVSSNTQSFDTPKKKFKQKNINIYKDTELDRIVRTYLGVPPDEYDTAMKHLKDLADILGPYGYFRRGGDEK